VNLSTDNIPEGLNNIYFNNGISNYLSIYANTSSNLLRLDNLSKILPRFL